MATHDYVIDNQSAPSLRADLNSVLQAIVTQNSSATAPTTTYANMVWYDTANNQLKKRNEADSAWITLGTIDESLGTFTQSGERALASQAQAEAGTDNTTVMTPLRVEQNFAANLTTSAVLTVLAGASAGAVGTYAFAATSGVGSTAGATIAGSSLRLSDSRDAAGASLSGTWRNMGGTIGIGAAATLFLRIS